MTLSVAWSGFATGRPGHRFSVAKQIGKPEPLIAERMAANEARFREANEEIEQAAESALLEELVPFLCECPRPECTELVRLDLTEYEAVRSRPTQFMTAPGHAVIGPGYARVVREHARFTVAEKEGRAAAVATRLDGRLD
jgi:hypothetical protein